MKKRTNKLFLLPFFMVFIVLLIASCTIEDNGNGNGIETEAPYFDPTQEIELTYNENEEYFEYSFMVDLPTPCYVVETSESIMESYPEQVAVDVTMRKTGDDMCAEVITPVEVTGKVPLANAPGRFHILLKGNPVYQQILEREPIQDDWRLEVMEMNKVGSELSYEFTLNLPTPCHSYALNERIDNNVLLLEITIIPPKGDVMCAQVIQQELVEGSFAGEFNEVKVLIDSEIVYERSFME